MYARVYTEIGFLVPFELYAAYMQKENNCETIIICVANNDLIYTKYLQTGRSKRSYRQVCVSRLISCVCDRLSASCSEGQSGSELPIFKRKKCNREFI